MKTRRNLFPCIVLLFVAVALQECESGCGMDPRFECPGPTTYDTANLKLVIGDVIYCQMGLYYGRRVDHVLLATSKSTVAHMLGNSTSGRGKLVEETWPGYVNGSKCWKGNNYGYWAARRAQWDVERRWFFSMYYNPITCNCEHWVNYWTTGMIFSKQVAWAHYPEGYRDPQCRVANQEDE